MARRSDEGSEPRPPDAELLAKALRGLAYNPEATRAFDLLAGGFVWSDEKPGPELRFNSSAHDAFRCLLGYRASLIGGNPRKELKHVWDVVQNGCPDWPGFRPERRDLMLTAELNSENARAMRRFEALDRLYAREEKKRKSTI